MKTRLTLSIFCVALLATLWLSNAAGRATVTQSGSTGAPGEDLVANVPRTCGGCHTGGTLQLTLALQVLDDKGTVVTKYSPGSVYTVKSTVNTSTATKPKAYGCEMVCIDSKNADVNGWIAGSTSANSKIAKGSKTNRTYVEQNGPSATNEFSAKWTAPAKGTGEITFYAACNGNNQNGGQGGDNAANTKVALSEGLVDVNDVAATIGKVEILANPFQSELILSIRAVQQNDCIIQILSLDGRVLQQQKQSLTAGEQTLTLATEQLTSGAYILSIRAKDAIWAKKIVKY
jgi:hypothetical protein